MPRIEDYPTPYYGEDGEKLEEWHGGVYVATVGNSHIVFNLSTPQDKSIFTKVLVSFRDAFPDAVRGGYSKDWHVKATEGSEDAIRAWAKKGDGSGKEIYLRWLTSQADIEEEHLHERRRYPKYTRAKNEDGVEVRFQMSDGNAAVVVQAKGSVEHVVVFANDVAARGMTAGDVAYERRCMRGEEPTHIVHPLLSEHIDGLPEPEEEDTTDDHDDQTVWTPDPTTTQPEEDDIPIDAPNPAPDYMGNVEKVWVLILAEIESVDAALGGALHKSTVGTRKIDGVATFSIHVPCNVHYTTASERLDTIKDAVCKMTQYRFNIELWREDRTTGVSTGPIYQIPKLDTNYVLDIEGEYKAYRDIEYMHALERLGITLYTNESLAEEACKDGEYNHGESATFVRGKAS